jgi:hypothetical protein
MKKQIFKSSLFLLLFCIIFNITKAQGPISITNAYQSDRSSTLPEGYINSAMIDYSPNCTGPCSANMQLIAITSQFIGGSSPMTKLYLDDGVSSFDITFPGAGADVVIGNYMAFTNEYLVGVIYSLPSIAPCSPGGNDIFLDVYRVAYVGTGSLYSSLKSSTLISTTGSASIFPHIDIIADYYTYLSNNIGGLPACYQFVATYTSNVQTITNVYMGAGLCVISPHTNPEFGINYLWGDLANPAASLPTINSYPAFVAAPYYADVAAVQRFQGLTSIPNTVAYVTYTDINGDLWEDEYNFTSPMPPSRKYLGNNMDIMPRIDAIDNINENNFYATIPPNFDYVIVDNDNSGSVIVTPGYRTALAAPTTYGGWIPSCLDESPVVSCGPKNYNIGYYHPDGFNDYVTSPSLDWNSSFYTGIPPINYYQVNKLGAFPTYISMSLSNTCNNDLTLGYYNPPQILSCWNNGIVFFKEAGDVTLWKPNNTASVQNVKENKDWNVFPNPATSVINIFRPDAKSSYTYSINDLSGKTLLLGAISNDIEQVNITNLSSGLYIIKIYSNSEDNKKVVVAIKKLTKQ